MAWKEWSTGTTTEVLYGADLNGNFDYLSSALAGGLTNGNFASGAIGDGNKIANDIVGEQHLNWAATTGPRVVQIGKSTAAAYEQFYCKGTSLITAANTTVTDITITYANGDICAAGEPVYTAVPHVKAWVYAYGTNGSHYVDVTTAGTATANVKVDLNAAETFAANMVVYWEVCGNV